MNQNEYEITLRTVKEWADYRLVQYSDGWYEILKGRELTGVLFEAKGDVEAIEVVRKMVGKPPGETP